jgi:Flp pilus assembly protein TadG
MNIYKCFIKLKTEESGAVVIIFALIMTVVIGFAALSLDLGLTYNKSSKLQIGLDSIALAAVRELPATNTSSSVEWSNAVEAAIKYAELNGVANITEDSVLPIYEDGKIIGLTVNGQTEVKYNFAQIFGMKEGTVNRKATAKLMKVNGVSGLLPLAMPKSVMDFIMDNNLMNEDITLKLGAAKSDDIDNDMLKEFVDEFDIFGTMSGNQGWRGAINFQGSDYKKDMEKGGYSGVVNIGDRVYTNSGTMPVDVDGKIVVGQTATIPVIDFDEHNILRVVGFVSFTITNLEGNNKNQKKVSILTSSYISDYITGGDSETGIVLNDYGVRAAKLVDY